MAFKITNPFRSSLNRRRAKNNNNTERSSVIVVVDNTSRTFDSNEEEVSSTNVQNKDNACKEEEELFITRRMDAANLLDDIIEFIETKSRTSTIFFNILDYSDVYINEIPTTYPKASIAAISKLPCYRVYPFDKEQHPNYNQTCTICYDRLIDGFALLRMPCGHLYHINCIIHWLGQSNACPECRYEIESTSSDYKYEISRKQRMRHIKTY